MNIIEKEEMRISYTCPLCNTKYWNKSSTERCLKTGLAYKHIRDIAEPGMVLILKYGFIPILKIIDKPTDHCLYSYFNDNWGDVFEIYYADWNQYQAIQNEPDRADQWLDAKCVTMTEAVINHGYRIDKDILKGKFKCDKIQKEYEDALREVVRSKMDKMTAEDVIDALSEKV